jgi:hypothetical protein
LEGNNTWHLVKTQAVNNFKVTMNSQQSVLKENSICGFPYPDPKNKCEYNCQIESNWTFKGFSRYFDDVNRQQPVSSSFPVHQHQHYHRHVNDKELPSPLNIGSYREFYDNLLRNSQDEYEEPDRSLKYFKGSQTQSLAMPSSFFKPRENLNH